ncbi:MAG: thioredoxin domain-containing protein, partial [Thermoanaerobaculia bacterium]
MNRAALLLVLVALTVHGDEPQKYRLAGETSPYLLQHADNPIDWYPWGEEAFARAKKESRPIFLSIGYSTCHWCHVMERESFSDPEIGALLDAHFVSIKVDREERPDIDAVYMAAARVLTTEPGWPLNVFLTPDGDAFFAASYLPKVDRGGKVGLETLLRRIAATWSERPESVASSAELVAAALG